MTKLFINALLLLTCSTALNIARANYPHSNEIEPISNQDVNSPFLPKIELGFKVGNKRSILQPNVLLPLYQSPNYITFLNIIAMGDSKKNIEGNFGLGFRYLDQNVIYGIYGYYDARYSNHNVLLQQATFGLELLTTNFELRTNGYFPTHKPVLTKVNTLHDVNIVHAGANTVLTRDLDGTFEETLTGFDFEIGGNLPNLPQWQNFIAYYHFRHPNNNHINGYRIRSNFDLTSFLAITAEISHDNARSFNFFAGAKLTYQFFKKQIFAPTYSIKNKMTQFPIRDIDIVTINYNKRSKIKDQLDGRWVLLNKGTLPVTGNNIYNKRSQVAQNFSSDINGIAYLSPNNTLGLSSHRKTFDRLPQVENQKILTKIRTNSSPKIRAKFEAAEKLLMPETVNNKTRRVVGGITHNAAATVTYTDSTGTRHYLMGKHNVSRTSPNPSFMFPGGQVDNSDSSFMDAALRELKEETLFDTNWYIKNKSAQVYTIDTNVDRHNRHLHVYQVDLGRLTNNEITRLNSSIKPCDDLGVALFVSHNDINFGNNSVRYHHRWDHAAKGNIGIIRNRLF